MCFKGGVCIMCVLTVHEILFRSCSEPVGELDRVLIIMSSWDTVSATYV